MRLRLKIVLAALLVAVLVVPAAAAKPGKGNGNGHGGGKPSWAGPKASSGGGEKAERGRPSWAGQGKAKQAERGNRAEKGKRGPARGDEADAGPRELNPAFVCRFERETLGDEAFADAYGTNENRANAFGKCVSREAKDRDGVDEGDGEEPETPEDGEELEDDVDTELPDEEPADAAAVLSLLRFLL